MANLLKGSYYKARFMLLVIILLTIQLLFVVGLQACSVAVGQFEANKNFDAGGFTRESFTWDYSFYFPNAKSATTNDPDHIKWKGLIATIKYPTVGDHSVTFTFKDSEEKIIAQGIGKIHIVYEERWSGKPRICYSCDLVRRNLEQTSGANDVDYQKTEVAARTLGLSGLTHHIPYKNGAAELEGLLKETDLEIWASIYSVGPENASLNRPFGADYEKWAEYFANLSLKYPNLKAFLMDDFHPESRKELTPAYVRKIMQSKNRINPNLKFLPVLYYDTAGIKYGDSELQFFESNSPYKKALTDGASMWYWGSYLKAANTANMTALNSYLSEANSVIPPALHIAGFYPIAYGKTDENDFYNPAFVKSAIANAISKSDGTSIFNVPLWVYDYDNLKQNASLFTQIPSSNSSYDYELALNIGRLTAVGLYQAIDDNLSLPGSITSATASFDTKDDVGIDYKKQGYQFKQLLVNDKVIWDADIADDGTDNIAVSKDIKPYLSGKLAKITIRLYDKRPLWDTSNFFVGNIRIIINGQMQPNNWRFDAGIAHIDKYKETLSAIAEAFAPYAEKVVKPTKLVTAK